MEKKERENFSLPSIDLYIENATTKGYITQSKIKNGKYIFSGGTEAQSFTLTLIPSSICYKIMMQRTSRKGDDKAFFQNQETILGFWDPQTRQYTYCYQVDEQKHYRWTDKEGWQMDKGYFSYCTQRSTMTLENDYLLIHHTYEDLDKNTVPLDQWRLSDYIDPIYITQNDIHFIDYFNTQLELEKDMCTEETSLLTTLEKKVKRKYKK